MRARIAKADALRDAGKLRLAADAYAAIALERPHHVGVRMQLANMLKDLGEISSAELHYQAVLRDKPDMADAYLQLGHLKKTSGQPFAALEMFREARKIDPYNASARHELLLVGDPGELDALSKDEAAVSKRDLRTALWAEAELLSRRQNELKQELQAFGPEGGIPLAQYDEYRRLLNISEAPAHSVKRLRIIVPTAEAALSDIQNMLRALADQSHADWHAFFLGSDAWKQEAVQRIGIADRRIIWKECPPDACPAQVELDLVASSLDADIIVLLDPLTIPHRLALGWISFAASISSAAALIWDQDKVELNEGRSFYASPILRSAIDRFSLTDEDVAGRSVALRTPVAKVDLQAMPFDRYRRALVYRNAGSICHVPFPLTSVTSERREPGGGEGSNTISATAASKPHETLSVIIPTRDNAGDVERFIRSLKDLASHPELIDIVILDNGSVQPENVAKLNVLANLAGVRLISKPGPFNWSWINNQGAAEAQAQILLFCNDDMRMKSRGWDDQVRTFLAFDEVGVVGGRLEYPDGSVQHAGIAFAPDGRDFHEGRGEPGDTVGMNFRYSVTRYCAAVTGAFLAIRRTLFLECGGFDERTLPISYSDVDLCFKVRSRGKRILWTPKIVLEHHESKTRHHDHVDPDRRARREAERQTMISRWGDAMTVDPGLHPAWLLETSTLRLLFPPSLDTVIQHIMRTGSSNCWEISEHQHRTTSEALERS